MTRQQEHRMHQHHERIRAPKEHNPIISFRMAKETKAALGRLAKKEGKTVSRLIVELIEEALEAAKEEF